MLMDLDLLAKYTDACAGTVGGPLNNETVPPPLRDYASKVTHGSTATLLSTTSESTATSTETGPQEVSKEASTSVPGELSSASTASSEASASDESKSALNVAAIIGIAVGGAALLFLVIGLSIFYLRRRKRKGLGRKSPPAYEPVGAKDVYDKPELDGQAVTYRYSESEAPTPGGTSDELHVGYAELDGGSPVSPARVPAELGGHARQGSM